MNMALPHFICTIFSAFKAVMLRYVTFIYILFKFQYIHSNDKCCDKRKA